MGSESSGWRQYLDHCPNGHAYTKANTVLVNDPTVNGIKVHRRCKLCWEKQKRRHRKPAPLSPKAIGHRSFSKMMEWYNPSHRTHCVNGHPFSPENTRIDKQGHRHCKACHREIDRQRYRKSRNAN